MSMFFNSHFQFFTQFVTVWDKMKSKKVKTPHLQISWFLLLNWNHKFCHKRYYWNSSLAIILTLKHLQIFQTMTTNFRREKISIRHNLPEKWVKLWRLLVLQNSNKKSLQCKNSFTTNLYAVIWSSNYVSLASFSTQLNEF